MTDTYEIYAVQYAHFSRSAAENFIGGDPHEGPMPVAYYVWAIVGSDRTFIFDTGFDEAMGRKRGRTMLRPVEDGLRAIGIETDKVEDVIISHMHFDHAGNHDLFPKARYHVQDTEMAYCTGRCMCHDFLKAPFEPSDVSAMVHKLFHGRVAFHDGESELAPGLSLHKLGGHSKGLQVARVKTRRGWVVLGSDASHFYANFEQYRPFPIVESATDMLNGYTRMRELASSIKHILPGHDPLVLERYPAARDGLDGVVRVDADPLY
jgi:glyoxylase-like metal-dependent hydrolase (beta-lactamase superfamily II)